jgi:molybdenum cofactor synthesis domain-containing protein
VKPAAPSTGTPPTRKEFRTLISLEEARELTASLLPERRCARMPLAEALDRVLAEDVVAARDVPPFTRSTMDGFAVRAAETVHADEERPVALRLVGVADAGHPAEEGVGTGQAIEIATGAVLPAGANAVVKVEHTEVKGDRVLVRRGVAPGENVMSAGDDLMLGDLVLPAGTILGPAELAVLAAAGEERALVWAPPRVGIFSVGDEVRRLGAQLRTGQIHDINGTFLAAGVRRAGGLPVSFGILPDDQDRIEDALNAAAVNCQFVITSGSTSAGAGDVIHRILELRGELLAHGIRVEPGKPTVLARLAGVPFVGLPGNPASAAVVFESLVAPLIRASAGRHPEPSRQRIGATLVTEIRPAPGRRLLRMVGVVGRGEAARAYPVEKRSGAITLLSQADGYIDVPEDVRRLAAGEKVEVVLFEDRGQLPDALFMGSHCLGLRPLFRALSPLVARTVHVGSLGGIRAVSRGIADAAGIHLLEAGGSYNITTLERMNVRGVALVRGYLRRQGWILPPGNPRAVRGLEDILELGLRIINRIGGSGTRILLDELLAREAARRGEAVELLAERIPGFDVEATSHSAVAAAVRAGLADAGLGIEAAASLNGLAFVAVAEENYDFLVSARTLTEPFGRTLQAALTSRSFAVELEELPGYRIDAAAGDVVWTCPEP